MDRTKKAMERIRAELVRRAHETADAIERILLEARPASPRRFVPARFDNEPKPDELTRARARKILRKHGLG